MTLNDLEAIALHEAGHGVVHHRYGDRVLFVRMDTPLTRAASPIHRAPIVSAICCLSGAAAEAVFIGRGYGNGCGQDIEDARRYLAGTNRSISDIWPRTLTLIRRYADDIELVANALLSRGRLDGDEFERVIERSWSSPRWDRDGGSDGSSVV
jgi:hypothetical protein